ncbi:MAG: hypothetical protein ACMXYK_03285 [Candidatus Woesearchaeota archaeon]
MNDYVLQKTAKEYFEMGDYAYSKGKANSAVILYFKSLVALIDLYILQRLEITPSSHTQRFELVKKHFQPYIQYLILHSLSIKTVILKT